MRKPRGLEIEEDGVRSCVSRDRLAGAKGRGAGLSTAMGARPQDRQAGACEMPGAPRTGAIIPDMGPNDHAMADALFTRSQQKVLGLLFGQADRQFHVNEMLRLTGAGKGALQRELTRLETAGLVQVTQLGNQKRYQANPQAPIYEALRAIVLKTFCLAD